MTAFELMERMSVEEMRMWVEYDRTHLSRADYQFAAIMAKLDWIKGVKRPDAERYLFKLDRKRRRKSLGELKSMFNAAVANSGGRSCGVARETSRGC